MGRRRPVDDQPGLLPRLAEGLALLTVALGALALLGWLAELPRLASFGAGKIPMAPSTALFFILLGGALLPLLAPRPSRRSAFAITLLTLALIGASLALLLASLRGSYFAVEYLGLTVSGLFNGVPVGHMSPLTAFSFLLAGCSLLGLIQERPVHWWPQRPLLAFVSASLLSLISFSLLLAYLMGTPILQGSGLVPPALSTALAFFSLSAALQFFAVWRLRFGGYWSRFRISSSHYLLGLIFVVLIGGLVSAGFVSVRHHEKEHLAAISQQLSAVASLKAERIAAWLREGWLQATELSGNQGFAERLERWLEDGSLVDREIVQARLSSQFATHNYDGLMLLDRQRELRYSLGDCLELDEDILATVARAEQLLRVERSELYRCPEGLVRLLWVAPIFSVSDGRPLAFVVRQVDARNFLFPFLASWPGTGLSGESLLVRREGDNVLFLNPSSFNPDAALKLGLPLGRSELPAVQAVLGREGVVESRDHRGVPVVAALTAVPGSEWFLLAKVDMAEVYAPLRQRLWVMVLVVMLLLLGAAGGVFLLWQRQRQAHGFTLLALAAARDRQLQSELEAQVARRTGQLQELNRELESFTCSVSHDLKAPLRGIAGFSRLLERDYGERLDDDGRRFLGHIRRGVEQMESLIAGLLAYSRVERQELRPTAVALADLVEGVLSGYHCQLAEAGVELELEIPAIKLQVDPEGFGLALRNLLDNAIKFSRNSRPPRITLKWELQGRCLRFTVRDNGIGFEMRQAERIFEIFTRLGDDAEVGGSGVGLALVRKAMQRMGGRVRAESAPGQGAAFFLEIPLAVPKNGVEPDEACRPDAEARDQRGGMNNGG